MTRDEILSRVRAAGGVDGGDALRASTAVVCALRERLDPAEAKELEAALGRELPEWFRCGQPEHPHRPPHRQAERPTESEIVARVRAAAPALDEGAARRVLRVVLEAIGAHVGGEEAEAAPEANVAQGVGGLAEPPKRRR